MKGTLLGARLVLLLLIGACQSDPERAASSFSAAAIEITHHECAACGMVVREQPAPRAQVVHRDGTRAAFCSVGDALHYLRHPSPFGAPVATWIEALPAEADPSATSTDTHPWVAASDLHFVVGVPRPQIMGPPVLAYRERNAASRVAEREGGRTRSWSELQTLIEHR